ASELKRAMASCATERRSFAPRPSPRFWVSIFTPDTSATLSTMLPTWAASCWARNCWTCFSAALSLAVSASMRSGISSGGLEVRREVGNQGTVSGEVTEGIHAGISLDTAHSRAHRGLTEHANRADLRGVVHVDTAAQLHGARAADLDGTDLIAVVRAGRRQPSPRPR